MSLLNNNDHRPHQLISSITRPKKYRLKCLREKNFNSINGINDNLK